MRLPETAGAGTALVAPRVEPRVTRALPLMAGAGLAAVTASAEPRVTIALPLTVTAGCVLVMATRPAGQAARDCRRAGLVLVTARMPAVRPPDAAGAGRAVVTASAEPMVTVAPRRHDGRRADAVLTATGPPMVTVALGDGV